MEREQAANGTRTSCKGQRNGGWATKLFPNNGLSISKHPFSNLDASGQSLDQEKNLEKPSVDPFKVLDLDGPYEQEELNKESSMQLNAIKLQQRHDSLEQRLKAVQDKNAFKGLNPNDLNLVSDLVIPSHFKMPRFEKYDGTSCPKMHLIMYCNKMTMHAHNEKLLIHIFQESLTGATSEWYLRLKRNQACTWRDLSRAFLE